MMTDPRYSAEVCRRVLELPGSAPLPADAVIAAGAAGNIEHGARVELRFQVAEGRILRGQFRAFGCPHVIAAASWVTDRLCGKGRDAIAAWDWREVADALDVPPEKFGRLLTVQDAVRDAARNWPDPSRSTV